jgi:hypothetical protein
MMEVTSVRLQDSQRLLRTEFFKVWYDQFGDRPVVANELVAPAFNEQPIGKMCREISERAHII